MYFGFLSSLLVSQLLLVFPVLGWFPGGFWVSLESLPSRSLATQYLPVFARLPGAVAPQFRLLTVHVLRRQPVFFGGGKALPSNRVWLAFCSVQRATIPTPRFLQRTIEEAGVGTFRDIATVQQTATVYDALSIFVERRVSALPVVDENGTESCTQTQQHVMYTCPPVIMCIYILFFFR